MLLDRIKQRREAIKQIGFEAAERASALGIEAINVVYPESKDRPFRSRMAESAQTPDIIVTKHSRIVANDMER